MSTSQDFSLIKQVVDKYFDFMEEIVGNQFITELIPPVMINPNRKADDESSYWNPIPSTVTDAEIGELETVFGHKLPDSFKFFLRQRHFIELQIGGDNISFFSNLPRALASNFKETIDEQFGNLLERNYLPFAYVADVGVLCFDANKKSDTYDYPVAMFNHEDGYNKKHFYTHNFLEMFNEFNSHLDEWINNNRIISKNTSS